MILQRFLAAPCCYVPMQQIEKWRIQENLSSFTSAVSPPRSYVQYKYPSNSKVASQQEAWRWRLPEGGATLSYCVCLPTCKLNICGLLSCSRYCMLVITLMNSYRYVDNIEAAAVSIIAIIISSLLITMAIMWSRYSIWPDNTSVIKQLSTSCI